MMQQLINNNARINSEATAVLHNCKPTFAPLCVIENLTTQVKQKASEKVLFPTKLLKASQINIDKSLTRLEAATGIIHWKAAVWSQESQFVYRGEGY